MRGWLLDTNVVAELAGRKCDPSVAAWAEAEPEECIFISVLTLAEYDKGVAMLPAEAPNRARIEASVAALEARFLARILPLSDNAVRRWGRISGWVKLRTGRSPPVIDTLLAATAIENDLHLVTRNVRDVAETGASVFNPWEDDPARFAIL